VKKNFSQDCIDIINDFKREFIEDFCRIEIWNYNLETVPYQNSTLSDQSEWTENFGECWKMRKLMPSRSLIDLIIVKVRQEFMRLDFHIMRAQQWNRQRSVFSVSLKKPRMIREIIDK
jgi:hypothetical protein